MLRKLLGRSGPVPAPQVSETRETVLAGNAPPLHATAIAEATFAAVDLETTGFSARGADRIVEVSIERFDSRGRTFENLTSLVQPGRSVGASWIHGIHDADVASSPTFDDLAPRILDLLRGTVVVGHNVAFDIAFLRAGFDRNGMALPDDAFVADTMRLAPLFYGQLGAEYDRRLPTCCQVMGLDHRGQHRAAGDVAATRAVFARCLQLGEERGWRTLQDFGMAPIGMVWTPVRTGRIAVGQQPRWNERTGVEVPAEPSPIRSVIEAMPSEQAAPLAANAVSEYRSLLERVVEDRVISEEEVSALRQTTFASELTRDAAIELHREILADQARHAGSNDGDLERLAWTLDLTESDLRAALLQPRVQPPTNAAIDEGTPGLRGKIVCFTGALNAEIDGMPLTRAQAVALAHASGLIFSPTVTKRVDILVIANPDSQSAKVLKARAYGVQVIAEQVFWRRLGGLEAACARLP